MTRHQYIESAKSALEEAGSIEAALEAAAEKSFTERDYAQWDAGEMTRRVATFLAAVREATGDENAYIELWNDNVSSKKVVVHH